MRGDNTPLTLAFMVAVCYLFFRKDYRMTANHIEGETEMAKGLKPAVAYLRTSSAANVGADKDSDKRQRAAIEAFAKRAEFAIVGEYYDAAVSGADHIDQRPGFVAMLQRLAANGAKTIIVESPRSVRPRSHRSTRWP